ncbi:hypothetical protein BIV23_10530 [Streptomyces monashensis]|uniref:Uncharacterized protein n=1 Tax=Streptomyces monashensis TaxID=1678012 RepID=A0A1S2QJB2_9ACTN|nr:hypothetical protein BIV23_10530 [Streptomyces monashensis]
MGIDQSGGALGDSEPAGGGVVADTVSGDLLGVRKMAQQRVGGSAQIRLGQPGLEQSGGPYGRPGQRRGLGCEGRPGAPAPPLVMSRRIRVPGPSTVRTPALISASISSMREAGGPMDRKAFSGVPAIQIVTVGSAGGPPCGSGASRENSRSPR